jgi:hypothetical protein
MATASEQCLRTRFVAAASFDPSDVLDRTVDFGRPAIFRLRFGKTPGCGPPRYQYSTLYTGMTGQIPGWLGFTMRRKG